MMTFLKINCTLLMIEGLAVIGLFMYWDFTMPADVVFSWFTWSFTREEFLVGLEKIGAYSYFVGAVGWFAASSVLWLRKHRHGRV